MERKSLMKRLLVLALLASATVATTGQTERPMLYITPTTDGFEVYLSAAMLKKEVPVTIVTKEESATLVLKASAVEIQQQSTGSKIARCLFAYITGMQDRGTTGV